MIISWYDSNSTSTIFSNVVTTYWNISFAFDEFTVTIILHHHIAFGRLVINRLKYFLDHLKHLYFKIFLDVVA